MENKNWLHLAGVSITVVVLFSTFFWEEDPTFAAHGGGGAGGNGQFHGGSGYHGGGGQFHGGGQYHPGYQGAPGHDHPMPQNNSHNTSSPNQQTGAATQSTQPQHPSHPHANTAQKSQVKPQTNLQNDTTNPSKDRPGSGIVTQYNHRTDLNQQVAAHPGTDHGTWNDSPQGRWYNGYWHNYWGDQNWEWANGAYGFWLGNTFVTETEPGICQYWDGTHWQPWYNPPATPYHCPY